MEWIVWGDRAEPLFSGTEEETKNYIINTDKYSTTLYIQSPDGKDYYLNAGSGEWTEI
jgi:hypothetical protein